MATYIAGTLKVTNRICVMRSQLAFGFSGASVKSMGCSSGATCNYAFSLSVLAVAAFVSASESSAI